MGFEQLSVKMKGMTVASEAAPSMDESVPAVGDRAPAFALPAIQGGTVELEQFYGRQNILLWFSRGFTCNFCRGHMEGMAEAYEALQAIETQVVQVAPNLLETARVFFDQELPPFPFVCDPDKRLYAVYGLGDQGALVAARNTVVSFGTAFVTGKGTDTVRGSWLDTMNRNFIRRLHHHAMTAVDQGLFIIDKAGVIRYRLTVGAIEVIPPARALLELTQALCVV
jgi:peroxiredoxin